MAEGRKGWQMKRLFLLEDDLSLINGLSFALKKEGYEIDQTGLSCRYHNRGRPDNGTGTAGCSPQSFSLTA